MKFALSTSGDFQFKVIYRLRWMENNSINNITPHESNSTQSHQQSLVHEEKGIKTEKSPLLSHNYAETPVCI